MPAGRATGSPGSDGETSELLLRACHDLRAPVRAIRAHAELVLRDPNPDTESNSERLGFIVDGARKIDLLVDGLTRYAIALQIDQGSFQSTATETVLRNVLARLRQELHAAGAEVHYDPLPRVWGTPDRLADLFENLLRNAVSHRGTAAPRIRITARPDAARWIFAVEDNGAGVEGDYLETIFQPFERLNLKHAGIGMGLAISRVIVERHGGNIWAESTQDKGSTFFFTLAAA